MELFQRQPGVKLYRPWIGTNFIVAYAYDYGTMELIEFGTPFAKITTTGDTDRAVRAIGQYIKTHKREFRDLTSDKWQAIIYQQKAMF